MKRLQQSRRWCLILTCAMALLLGIYTVVQQFHNNFHTVVAGELYRSAQVSGDEVAEYVARHGIRTILNLRGENKDKRWYKEEMAASQAAGITHLDFRMSVRRGLNEPQARELMALMQAAEKPLLIHCDAGSDRTGLAAALYLLVAKNVPTSEAYQQLWPIYGHFSLPLTRGYNVDRSFKQLAPIMAPGQ